MTNYEEQIKKLIQEDRSCEECSYKKVCDNINFNELSDCDFGFIFNKLVEVQKQLDYWLSD
jgi:hypothetical protein